MNELSRKIWIALFSQSGSELKAICEELGRYPNTIMTNNKNVDWHTDASLFFGKNIMVDSPSEIFSALRGYHSFFNRVMREDVEIIITLHGFLRILPADICDMFEIYNGHPGDILNYNKLHIQSLVGKDPQKRALEYGHNSARAVIHKVIPEVDDGEVVAVTPYVWLDTDASLEGLCEKLKTLSVIEWVKLLKEKL